MKGFATEGLVIFPKGEIILTQSEDYINLLEKTTKKLCKYFNSIGIELKAFNSQEALYMMDTDNLKVISCITDEDKFIIEKDSEIISKVKEGSDECEKYFDEARKKYPTKRGMGIEQRFELMEKKDRFICNKYIEGCKFVITLENENNKNYKVIGKKNDERIILKINYNTFAPQTILSGEPIDVAYMLPFPTAYRAVYLWEV